MLKTQNTKLVDLQDWDELVQNTYGKPYSFQQQDGCQDRGVFNLTVPSEWAADEEMHDSIPEVVNGEEMGVKFAVWLARDPKQPLAEEERGNQSWLINMFWERNFYPDIHTLANDLHEKGLLEAGDYTIEIDW